jgi:WXG100 family type VII secretion target
MADQIRLSPDQMRSRANEYTAEANKVQDVIQKMDNLLRNLQSEWEGAASQSYAGKFAELRPGFVKSKELIDEIAAALNKMAANYEQLDQSHASSLNN